VEGRHLLGAPGRLILNHNRCVAREAGGHGATHGAHAHDADAGARIGHAISTG
jgi:hypothetical protein